MTRTRPLLFLALLALLLAGYAPAHATFLAEDDDGARGGESFTVATFNVLGNSHTSPGGKRAGWASGPARMRGAVGLLDEYDVEIVGLQELQGVQHATLLDLAGDRYGVFSAPGDNAIAWRADRWSMVRSSTFTIPYFHGRPREMPIVVLESLADGSRVAVVNVHNPANTRRAPRQGRFRAEALRREAGVVRALRAEGLDVVLLGDFNDRRRAYCTFVTRLGMEASHRGGSGDGCRPPREASIDWIFATDALDLRDHTSVGRTLAGISDHQLVVSRVVR